MNKQDLKYGYYYKSMGGEYYKYDVINNIPIFRISKYEYIKLDEFDDHLESDYKPWTIIEELNKQVITADYISRFVSLSGNEIPFLVSEDKTGESYMCYQGLKMFKFADGGIGNSDVILNNWAFEENIKEEECENRYVIQDGEKRMINLWSDVVLVSPKEKIVLSKSDLKKRFSLVLENVN